MKSGFLFSGLFWGSVLVLFGMSLIIKVIFNISIPILRILVALFLIYLGIRIIVGGFSSPRGPRFFFEEKTVNAAVHTKDELQKEYTILFGKGVIDLTSVPTDNASLTTKVTTVFGNSTIRIKDNQPVKLSVDAAFAGAIMPDGNIISFGKYIYKTKDYREDIPHLDIEASAVFSRVELEIQKTKEW